MGTIKSFTDISQSKVLAEILPLDNADMCWQYQKDRWVSEPDYEEFPQFEHATDKRDIPCWSLAALLSIIPKEINIEGQRYAPCLFPVQDKWLLILWHNSNHTITSPIAIFSDNPIDACYEMVIKLNEQKLL